MRRSNAAMLLPEELLFEIQQYVQGKSVYIPKIEGSHKKWGDNTKSKTLTLTRNNNIRSDFHNGLTIEELTERYCLSPDSVKKIVYCKR